MNKPTRSEQAEAILKGNARDLASKILARRATSAEDFVEAFNLERIDMIAEIEDHERLLSFGINVVGPRDGIYVIDDGDSYRVYLQERGETMQGVEGVDFSTAVDTLIDLCVLRNGIPWRPIG